LEGKSVEPIRLAFAEPGKRRNMTNFMTNSVWDDQGMLEDYQREVAGLLFRPEGMITGDVLGFPKKGSMSCGVARQRRSPLGQLDNCQAGVFVGYSGPLGDGLLDYELFMPERWFGDDYQERREKCRVPEGLEFKTMSRILSEMIAGSRGSGAFKGRYVGVDAAFSRDQAFLDSLPPDPVYFADVQADRQVFTERPETTLPDGRGPRRPAPSMAPRAVGVIVADEAIPWNDVTLGHGSQGPVLARDKIVKVVEARGGQPGLDVWLYARRLDDGNIRYSLRDESMDAEPAAVRIPAGVGASSDASRRARASSGWATTR
jgi:hypothetical protein